MLPSKSARLLIAHLQLLEPADSVALISYDLRLPKESNRHSTHEDKTEDEGDSQVGFTNLTPKSATNPFHGGVLLVPCCSY